MFSVEPCALKDTVQTPPYAHTSPDRSLSFWVEGLTRRWKLNSCSIRVFRINNRNIRNLGESSSKIFIDTGSRTSTEDECELWSVTNTEIEYQLQLQRGANTILKPEKRNWAYFHGLVKTYDLSDLGFIMICCADGALLFLSEKNNLLFLLIDTHIQYKIACTMLYVKLSNVALGVWDFLILISPDPIMMKQKNKSLQLAPQETKGIEFE